MKRRGNKEVNIFSMSMLDVISGALGAFILLAVIFMPYFKKETRDVMDLLKKAKQELAQRQEELAQTQSQLQQSQQQLQQAESRAQQAEEELNKTFVVIYISWETSNQDVDLYVTTPRGNTFYYSKKTIPGEKGRLSVDAVRGPATEVWEVLDATPGVYRIEANLHSLHGNNDKPKIKGNLSFKRGNINLPSITIRTKGQRQLIANVRVHPDGNVTVE